MAHSTIFSVVSAVSARKDNLGVGLPLNSREFSSSHHSSLQKFHLFFFNCLKDKLHCDKHYMSFTSEQEV